MCSHIIQGLLHGVFRPLWRGPIVDVEYESPVDGYPSLRRGELGYLPHGCGSPEGSRSVGFVLAMFIMGAISDRVGRKPVVLFGLGATAVFIASLGFVSSFWGIATVMFVLGISTGGHLDRYFHHLR